MKIKKLSAVLFIVMALLLISTSTAFARPTLARFTIDNNSAYPAYIYMNGAGGEYYYLTVAAGTSSTFTVERVKYTYKLVTCGGTSANGSIELKDGGSIVVPATCETKTTTPSSQVLSARPQLGRFTIDNRSAYTAYVYLRGSGGQFYYLAVAAKTSKTYTVDRTTYKYDLNSCGGKMSKNKALDLSHGGSLVVPATCETSTTSPSAQILSARPQLGRFTVDNRSAYTAYVYLHGSGGQYYYLAVAAKTSKTFTVERTKYTYNLNSCGGKLSKNNALDLSHGGSLVVPATCESKTTTPSAQVLSARPQLARFLVDNNSEKPAYVYMHGAGGQFYYLTVGAEKAETFTVDRTTYTYNLNTCGGKLAKNLKIDLSNGGSIGIPDSACEP